MNHIGNVIKSYRKILGMSRADLSENICSEKYVYLIEKGERTPSADMVRQYGDRMGVDLFDHYQYLDCINPVSVRETIKKLSLCQRKTDFDAARKIMEEAAQLPDFRKKPWIYELEANRLGYMVFVENKFEEAISCANRILQNMESKYLNSGYIVNLYILLSTCYQIRGDLVNAKRATLAAYDIIRPKYNIEKYDQVIVSIRLNLLTLYYLSGELDKAIHEGKELIQYQYEHNSYARIHFAYAFLAFSYYKTGAYDEAFLYFGQAVYVLMAYYNPIDVQYITTQDIFEVMAGDKKANPYLISEFKEKYSIGQG